MDNLIKNSVLQVEELNIFYGSFQAVLGVVNASTHSCAVSFPGEFAEFDGGDESSDDFSKAFGGDFIVSCQGGEDRVWGHGSVFIKDDGRGMVVGNKLNGVGARGCDGVVDAVIGHA